MNDTDPLGYGPFSYPTSQAVGFFVVMAGALFLNSMLARDEKVRITKSIRELCLIAFMFWMAIKLIPFLVPHYPR